MIGQSEIKYIQSLFQKKYREREGLFIAEGCKIVEEAIHHPHVKIHKIFALPSWIEQHLYDVKGIDVVSVNDATLKKISQLKTPHKVLCLIHTPDSIDTPKKKKGITLALDGMQDPGNMGSIIRTADWYGIQQIVCSNDSCDVYNGKVVQATMGSLFRVNILYTDLVHWLSTQKNIAIYGAALEGIFLHSFKNEQDCILIIGNESTGIRNDVMKCVHKKVTIEKIGKAESLNAAIATGIILSKFTAS